MSYCGCCSTATGLGFAPAPGTTTINYSGGGGGGGDSIIRDAFNFVGGLFRSSDPAKDRERFDRIDATLRAAVAGDPEAERCLYDMSMGVSSGPADPRSCAVGSAKAAEYAKQVWAGYQARTAGTGYLPGAGAGEFERLGVPPALAGALASPTVWIGLAAVGLLFATSGSTPRRRSR